jgi:hypothetical protein
MLLGMSGESLSIWQGYRAGAYASARWIREPRAGWATLTDAASWRR